MRILEGSVDSFFFPGLSKSLSSQLTEIIEKEILTAKAETGLLPDLIQLRVSQEKVEAWNEIQDTLDAVSKQIEESSGSEGLRFSKPLRIQVLADEHLGIDEIKVNAAKTNEDQVTTATLIHSQSAEDLLSIIPRQACLIISGKAPLMLETAVVSIGRHSSNDVVIHDPQVSRKHLQLRAEKGSYLLFDLSSTGGTLINKKRVSSAKLKPGDVIQIGKTMLIYNQEQSKAGTGTRVLSQMGGKEV